MPMSTTSNVDCIQLDITQLPILLPIFINKIVDEGVIIRNKKPFIYVCLTLLIKYHPTATNKIKTSVETASKLLRNDKNIYFYILFSFWYDKD